MEVMECPECGETINVKGNKCGKCGSDIREAKAGERKANLVMFIGAVIGAMYGVANWGFLGLLLAFPGMFVAAILAAFLPSRKK